MGTEESQDLLIAQLLSRVNLLEWEGATLKKLPLWGHQTNDNYIDFEWPTAEEFASWSPDTTIESIDMEKMCSNCKSLTKIKVNLSNGESKEIIPNY